MLFGLVGGLGFFLFGMNMMSRGFRRIAGDRIKNFLNYLTTTPFIGILVGAFVTCIIQSSSSTTVIVIGLVNAGLLTLRQAIGVVMGANIGTTITAWIISFLAVFKITTYALPAVGLGFLLSVIGKKQSTRNLGEIILGSPLPELHTERKLEFDVGELFVRETKKAFGVTDCPTLFLETFPLCLIHDQSPDDSESYSLILRLHLSIIRAGVFCDFFRNTSRITIVSSSMR